MNKKSGQILSVAALLGVIFMNYLANALPLAGKNTGELSALYPNKFVPAGMTFGIWGLIYIMLLVYVLYPFFSKGSASSKGNGSSWKPSDQAFLLSCVGNVIWLLFWHYEMVLLSTGAMLFLLGSLIQMWKVHRAEKDMNFWRWAPVSLYLGWISVATIANFTVLFVSAGFEGGAIGATTWSIIMMTVAFVLGLYFRLAKGDYIFALVLAWAFLGIGVKHMETDIMVWIMAVTYLVFTLVFLVSVPVKKLLAGG